MEHHHGEHVRRSQDIVTACELSQMESSSAQLCSFDSVRLFQSFFSLWLVAFDGNGRGNLFFFTVRQKEASNCRPAHRAMEI